MAFIVWDELYDTGIKTIDDQHKQLVSLINRMFEALMQQKGKEELSYVIEEMAKYAEYHFEVEEKMLSDVDYPEIEEHLVHHDAFICKVDDFRHKFNAQDEALTAEVTIFLTNWLNEHLMVIDQKYVPYMKKNGISKS